MEILNFKESPVGSYELATFDLDFGPKWGMGISKLKVCRSKDGRIYYQPSSYKIGEGNGKENWKPYFYTYGDKGKDLSNAILDLLQPYIDLLGKRQEKTEWSGF